MMIERLRELRLNLRGIVVEIDEIERGVIEKPVPWYEEEWWVEDDGIYKLKNGGKCHLATAGKPYMTARIMGMQKLVRSVVGHFVGVKRDTDKEHREIRAALKEMGVEVE